VAHRILLVDDSATIQQLVKLAFAGEGIEVQVASSVAAAKEQLTLNIPDLILAETSLPDEDSFELFRLVRSHPEFSKIPLILLVSAGAPLDPRKVRTMGADGMLTKPFESIKTLVETVRSCIERRTQVLEFDEGLQPASLAGSLAKTLPALEEGDEGVDSILEVDDLFSGSGRFASSTSQSAITNRISDSVLDDIAARIVTRLIDQLRREVVQRAVPEVVAIVAQSFTEKSRLPSTRTPRDIDEAGEITDD
jgi:DNA-binding response OmpR family regulator